MAPVSNKEIDTVNPWLKDSINALIKLPLNTLMINVLVI